MSEAIRYNATKVVGEYGSVARLQHRLHLAPSPKGNWVKWEDYAFLKMEIERLVSAGEDLSHAVRSKHGIDFALEEWDKVANTEGKQS
jgi:hypothetical protein